MSSYRVGRLVSRKDHEPVELEEVDGMLRHIIVCCDCGLVHLMSIDTKEKKAYFVREDGPAGVEIRKRLKKQGHKFRVQHV